MLLNSIARLLRGGVLHYHVIKEQEATPGSGDKNDYLRVRRSQCSKVLGLLFLDPSKYIPFVYVGPKTVIKSV